MPDCLLLPVMVFIGLVPVADGTSITPASLASTRSPRRRTPPATAVLTRRAPHLLPAAACRFTTGHMAYKTCDVAQLVFGLDHNPGVKNTAGSAMDAIALKAEHGGHMCADLGELGAVEAAIKAMDTLPAESWLQQQACHALHSMITGPGCPRNNLALAEDAGGRARVELAIAQHPDDAYLQEFCGDALQAIGFNSGHDAREV